MDLDRHSTDGAVGLLEEGKVVLYWQRWWWLAVYFVVTVCNAMTFITFGPIDVTSAAFFEQGLLAINVTTGVGTVFSILFMLPILAFVKRFGLGTTMRLSSACNVVAGAVRIVAPFLPVSVGAYFWILFGSQVVAMVANPPLTAVVPELSSHWFPPSERSIATSAGSLATLVGLAAGYAMSGFIIGSDAGVPLDVLRRNFEWLFVAQGIALVALAVPGLFFQSAPPTPPCVSGADHGRNGMSFGQEIKQCLKQPAFVVLLSVLGVGYGMFVALWSTMQELVISTPLAAWIGIAFVGGGIVGATIAGLIVDKWRIYRPVLTVGSFGSLAAMILFFFGLLPINESWLIGSAVSAGFFLIALLPVVFETAVEVTFPVNESTSAGLLIMIGNLFAIIFVVAYTVESDSAVAVTGVIIVFFAGTVQQMFSFRPEYKRLAFEQRGRDALLAN